MLFKRLSAIALLGAICAPTLAYAGEVSLRYEDFFSRMKIMHKENYQLVELTFSVPMTAGCQLTDASISTERRTVPLSYTKAQRLYLPYDVELKQQRALVNLDVEGDGANCGLAVQIRAKSPKVDYDSATLTQLYREMDEMQGAMKGFPMKYFHDAIKGVRYTLPADTRVVVTRDKGYEEFNVTGEWSMTHEQIAQAQSLTFSATPEVISPWVE